MASDNPLSHVVQHPLVQRDLDLGFLTPEGKITVFSDHIAMLILAGLLVMIALPLLMRRRRGEGEVERHLPTHPRNFVELICSFLRDEVARPVLGEHTDRFIKFIWSLFFFLLAVNLLGLVPLGPLSQLAGTHLGGTATGNIWVVGTLAVVTMGMMVINGLRLGGMQYLAHFNPGPWWLAPLMVPVEIISLISKIFALAVRLFANMVAGHIMLSVLVGFILSAGAASVALGFGIALPVVLGSVAISLLELLVAFLHAFIFTVLTAIFIGQSVLFHHEEAAAH